MNNNIEIEETDAPADKAGGNGVPAVLRPEPKRRTAQKTVNLISFILILALTFLILNRVFAIDNRFTDARISPEIVLSDMPPDEHFFNGHMGAAHYHAMQVLYFMSEESIIAGDHLMWNTKLYEEWDEWDEVTSYFTYFLTTPDGRYHYAELFYEDYSDEKREQFEQFAIRRQLEDFRNSIRHLRDTEGLMYFLLRGTQTVFSNTGEDYGFMSQPVYLVSAHDFFATSHDYHGGRDWTFSHFTGGSLPIADDMTLYLAFTGEVVSVHRDAYFSARQAYIRDFAVITASGILILALLVILVLGACRKPVYFTLADRPFLDISLAAVIFWTAAMAYIAVNVMDAIGFPRINRSIAAMNIFYAAAPVVFVSPVLLWFLSLVKRVRAGSFWRHTLIYLILSRSSRLAVRHAKSLWAGFPLTGKVGLISLASFLMLLITGLAGYGSYYNDGFLAFVFAVIFTAAVTFFLLRYARRIYKLEEGARRISGGDYDEPAESGGGELGSIANSINSISAGINNAVELRLKSERLKTELITNVSHDIRTPLTSIITYTDLLKHEGLNCEKAPEYLDILIQKSQRLKTLTDELFEAAKAATGNIEVNLTELDLVSLINQVLGELDGALKSSGLEMRVNLPESLMVKADGKLMWRILDNLLSNVFKYSLPGSRVYLDAQPEGDYVRIELKNISATELNIDPNELTDRFKRGDDSRADGGSGLGLSIVQSFVAAQGGRFSISIDGDLFKAAVFLIKIC